MDKPQRQKTRGAQNRRVKDRKDAEYKSNGEANCKNFKRDQKRKIEIDQAEADPVQPQRADKKSAPKPLRLACF